MSDHDPDSVDFLCKDDNILLPLVSLTFSCVATVTVGFYIFQKLTKLRISLFLTSVATTLAAGTNILWEIYDCEHKFFHYLFNLIVFELFIFVVVWCFLDIGKKFYPPNQRNTLFFKVIIGACVIFGMGGASQIAFTIHDNTNPNETTAKEIIYMADIVLGWILLTLAFFYTFKPIIKFRIFSKRQMSTINPRNSAVGIWYLLVTSLISMSYLSFMIYMFTKGFETPKIFRGPNSKAIDYIHRTVLILNQSLPPPNYILNLIGKIEAYATPQNTNNRNINILDSNINDTATSETVININNNNNFNNKNIDDSKDINNNDTKISLDTSDGSLDSSNSTL